MQVYVQCATKSYFRVNTKSRKVMILFRSCTASIVKVVYLRQSLKKSVQSMLPLYLRQPARPTFPLPAYRGFVPDTIQLYSFCGYRAQQKLSPRKPSICTSDTSDPYWYSSISRQRLKRRFAALPVYFAGVATNSIRFYYQRPQARLYPTRNIYSWSPLAKSLSFEVLLKLGRLVVLVIVQRRHTVRPISAWH